MHIQFFSWGDIFNKKLIANGISAKISFSTECCRSFVLDVIPQIPGKRAINEIMREKSCSFSTKNRYYTKREKNLTANAAGYSRDSSDSTSAVLEKYYDI